MDFMNFKTSKTFSEVFISGVIHHRENLKYSLEEIINKLQSLVSKDGTLPVEYIHRSNRNNDPTTHFLTASQIKSFFRKPEWGYY